MNGGQVQRLSGLDAFFLYVETPSMHTHVALTAVLDPSTMPGGYSFDRLRDHIAQRAALIPPFHRRVVEAPLRLHHPIWVDEAELLIDSHLKRVALPPPGKMDDLARIVERIASAPLDRSMPLWEMWVVEGLEGGRIALVGKIHHAALDGVGAMELMPVFFDLEPNPPARATPLLVAGSPPTSLEMLGGAAIDKLRAVRRLPGLVARTGEAIAGIRQRRSEGLEPGGTPLTAPRTRFNAPITADRSVAFSRVPLDAVKAVKQAFGATVNDVVLATCALAMRRYLEAREGAPATPLVAACPVSVGSAAAEAGGANASNRLSVMFTEIHSELTDPGEVLEATCASAAAAKHEHELLGQSTLSRWAEVADPLAATLASRLYHRLGGSEHHPPALSMILSNIAGPSIPVYLAGAELVAAYPFGPVLDGAGLNVTVMSYRGSIDFGFLAASALAPDIEELAEAVPAAFADLEKAAMEPPFSTV